MGVCPHERSRCAVGRGRARAERHLVPFHPVSVSHPAAGALLESDLLKVPALTLPKRFRCIELRID